MRRGGYLRSNQLFPLCALVSHSHLGHFISCAHCFPRHVSTLGPPSASSEYTPGNCTTVQPTVRPLFSLSLSSNLDHPFAHSAFRLDPLQLHFRAVLTTVVPSPLRMRALASSSLAGSFQNGTPPSLFCSSPPGRLSNTTAHPYFPYPI